MKLRTVLFGSLALLAAWALYADYSLGLARYFTEDPGLSLQEAGVWGDSFGGFNALVSTVGAAVVIWTLLLQQKALREQAADLHQQKFESTFFELLSLMRELRSELRFKYSKTYKAAREKTPGIFVDTNETHHGIDAIIYALHEIVYWHRDAGESTSISSNLMKKLYSDVVFKANETTFAPYFRMIYTILDRIRADRVLEEYDKIRYANILRSKLTERELYMLAYNASHPVSKDLTSLIVEFRMFKYMPETRARRRIEANFPARAFAARD